MTDTPALVLWFDDRNDVARVGGKNASLADKPWRARHHVPLGFATTAEAYWRFIDQAG